MSTVMTFAPGGYRFARGVFQYSAGVAAQPGLRIERVRFLRPVPLSEGFTRAAAFIRGAGRPLTAFCACELRSPAPFDETGFRVFNESYVGTLRDWGLFDGTVNPVARSNVCPQIDPPSVPSFHAFSFTTVAAGALPSFVVAGSGEAREGGGSYQESTVSFGDVSPAGLRNKARWVLGEMQRRMALLGFGWADATATQLYTVHDVHSFLADELVRRGAMAGGLTWHFNRPPVVNLEYEMDCRAVHQEHIIAG
jgi:hypothetical protein